MPAAVLIGDVDQQWLSTAIPLVLQQDLATSASIAATFVPDASTAYQLQSTTVLRSTVEERNGRYRLQATLTNTASQQNRRIVLQEGSVRRGISTLLDDLAKQIDPARASAFSSRSNDALQLFVSAVNSADASARSRLLEATVSADPNFGLAQIARRENALTSPLPSSPADVISGTAFVPLDRARWNALLARTTHAPLSQRAKTEAAVLSLAPNDVEALSSLGVERFLLGQGSEGERLLRQAMSLSPTNATLPIQLAQGLVTEGQFSKAAAILRPLTNTNANLLLPLALVELLNHDRFQADKAFRSFISFLPPGNQAVPALESQWQRFVKPSPSLEPNKPPSYWKNVIQQSDDTNLAARALYAAALEQAGQSVQARSVHVLPFIPEFSDLNAPAAFYQMRRLTGH